MLRNLGIRWQILSALALPVLVLGLISSQVTYQALVDMREASQSRELALGAGGFADLVGGLQAERALSVAAVIGQPGAKEKLAAVRGAVNQGLAGVRTRINNGSTSTEVQQILAVSAAGHDALPALRAEVDAGKLEARAIVSRYSAVIVVDVEIPSDLAGTLRSQESAANFQRFAQLTRAGEALAQEQLIGATAIMNGKADTVDQRELGAQAAAGQVALDAFRRSAGADQRNALKLALAAPSARSLNLASARAAFQFAGTVNRPDVKLADWQAITTGQLAALRTALNSIYADGIAVASRDYSAAKQTLQLTLGGALGITLLTLLLALGLSRRISAPLRRLTQAATQIRDELPNIVAAAQSDEHLDLNLPTVQIVGHNEVSRLAAAFVDVNAVTVRIAREQARLRAAVADMFVNVARRNQVLLSRQLSLIDQLERNEVNPDALEELFRLDHLATRMRRNAESLLVLAGIESGRRLREPMPLSDVVRTATSEIEHYSRVSLSLAADPPVFAHLALPIAHLLAELLENATNFSDPGSAVVVMASATEQGVRITVADDGLGIPAEELLEINARIDEPPTAEALSSQRLGFFVVGRLAQRLDAKVTLTSGRARGTAVLVDLPASLFVPGSLGEPIPDSVQDQHAGRSRPAIPDQSGAPVRSPEPVGALAGGHPFVAAFPSAPAAAASAPVVGTDPAALLPAQLPALPAAFNSAAFDSSNALESVWTPQPDNLPLGEGASAVVEPASTTGLPARRTAVPVPTAPLAVPNGLPLPGARPESEPAVIPVSEPLATLPTQPVAPGSTTLDPLSGAATGATPEWAESDWAVSEWAAPLDEEPAATLDEAPDPASPMTEVPGASLFSGFRSRQAAAEAVTEPEAEVRASLDSTPPAEPAPMAFLDSAVNVGDWFEATTTAEADHWQAWDEVATLAPTPTEPVSASAGTEAAAPSWDAAQDAGEYAGEYEPARVDHETWDAEPPVELSGPVEVTPPIAPEAPVVAAAETWTPAPALEPAARAPEPEPAAWTPEPVPETWAPEPVAYPVPEAWVPEPAAEAWAPEPVAYQGTPETWTPEPAPAAWTPEPDAWSPQAQPPARPPTPEPLMQTLTAAIDILPQRTSIRTALRRGRRKGDPRPSDGKPFNGGFDPIAPAREFARREGFGSTHEPENGVGQPETVGHSAAGLVPEPSRPWESAAPTVERRQHLRSGDQPAQEGRSALASEALTELSRLSSYSPTSMPPSEQVGLQRRTPSEVPLDESQPAADSGGGQRARTAASVRSMLAGFKAGVERGRTSPSANRPAPQTLPPPPRDASTGDSR